MQPGLQSVGAVNSYSRTINNYQLTVMGEVHAETVRFIAEGIKLRDFEKLKNHVYVGDKRHYHYSLDTKEIESSLLT